MTSVDSVVMLHPISLADSVLDLDLSVLSVEVEVVETLTNADFVNQVPMIPLEAKLVLPIAKKENLFVRDPVRHNVEDFEPLKYTYIIQSTHIVADFSIICYSIEIFRYSKLFLLHTINFGNLKKNRICVQSLMLMPSKLWRFEWSGRGMLKLGS